MARKSVLAVIGVIVVIVVTCPACSLVPKLAAWISGSGAETTAVVPAPSPSSAQPAEDAAEPGVRGKANAELLHEIFLTVFQREPKDRSEFGNYVDTLNQGASLEGIYNGFTHSGIYRQLEVANAGASVEALRVFGEELAEFEVELPEPTRFDEKSAQPLSMPVMPTGGDAGDKEVSFGKPAETSLTPPAVSPRPVAAEALAQLKRTLAERYSKTFVGSSIFTLKRILGDEALRTVELKKESRTRLSVWYAKWVVRMCGRRVDFGLALRNKPDELFHYEWAQKVSIDQLQWEILNRVHRLLNEANRQKQ